MKIFKRLDYYRCNMGLIKFTILLFIVSSIISNDFVYAKQAERFKDVKIRVIRPRYFTKAKRFELGAGMNMVMNESFIYTFLATGLATYHFTETWSIEAMGSLALVLIKMIKNTI